jgi:hypothetical protein
LTLSQPTKTVWGALDRQVKVISIASGWLLDYNEAWVTLFHEERLTPMASTFVEDFFPVILLSAPAAVQDADP